MSKHDASEMTLPNRSTKQRQTGEIALISSVFFSAFIAAVLALRQVFHYDTANYVNPAAPFAAVLLLGPLHIALHLAVNVLLLPIYQRRGHLAVAFAVWCWLIAVLLSTTLAFGFIAAMTLILCEGGGVVCFLFPHYFTAARPASPITQALSEQQTNIVALHSDESDEALEEGAAAEARDQTSQDFSRGLMDEGGEFIRFRQVVSFVPGQQTGVIHLPFCPPLASVPELEIEAESGGGEVRFRTTYLTSHGLRCEVKRSGPLGKSDEVVVIGYAACPVDPPSSAVA